MEDARIRWDLPAHIIDRVVRAYTPAPGAWTVLEEARIKVGPVRPVAADDASLPESARGDALAPGVIAVTKKAVFVGTGSTPVRLGTVQPPGKKAMPAADWARGARLETARCWDERRSAAGPGQGAAGTFGPEPREAAEHRQVPAERSTRPASPPATSFAPSGSATPTRPVLPKMLRERGITGRDAAFATELATARRALRGCSTR